MGMNVWMSRQIYKLMDSNGKVIQDQKGIQAEVYKFYSTLYESKPIDKFDWNILESFEIPKLDTHMKESLEGQLTLDEISLAIKNMKNIKSPGLDGFTVEFF